MGPRTLAGEARFRGCVVNAPERGENHASLERGRSASLSQLPGATVKDQPWHKSMMPDSLKPGESTAGASDEISSARSNLSRQPLNSSSRPPLIKRPTTSSAKLMTQILRSTIPERPAIGSLEDMPFKLCNLSDFSVLPTGPLLSHNSLASVYVSRTTTKQYVIKQVTKRNAEKLESLLHEAGILTHISNLSDYQNYVVGFHGMDMGMAHNILPALVFEKLECSLHDWIKHNLSVSPSSRRIQLKSILDLTTIQLTTALSWLHEQAKVVHGDIKPSNILIRFAEEGGSSNFTLVFADFASACIIKEPKVSRSGLTYAYMAPENLKAPHDPPTTAGDVWAMAVTLLELVAGRTPYSDVSPRVRKLAAIGNGEPVANVEDEVRKVDCTEFVKMVLGPALMKNPQLRIKAIDWPPIACLFSSSKRIK